MLFVREFEIFRGEKYLVVVPCDMGGATQGVDMQDAIDSAADWLYYTVVYDMISGKETEGGVLGHKPEHGGQIIVVAVDVDLARVPAYSAAEAARVLGVSPARVAQMCEPGGPLTSWKEGSRRIILKESVDSRLMFNPGPGRPKKKPAAEAKGAATEAECEPAANTTATTSAPAAPSATDQTESSTRTPISVVPSESSAKSLRAQA